MPRERRPRIKETQMRWPRTHGRPPHTSGSIEIRSRRSCATEVMIPPPGLGADTFSPQLPEGLVDCRRRLGCHAVEDVLIDGHREGRGGVTEGGRGDSGMDAT